MFATFKQEGSRWLQPSIGFKLPDVSPPNLNFPEDVHFWLSSYLYKDFANTELQDSPVTVDAQQRRICKYQDAEELTSSPIPDTMRVSKPIFHSTTRRRPGVQKLAGRGVPTQTDQTTFIMFSMTCNDSLRSKYLQARPTHLSMPQSGEIWSQAVVIGGNLSQVLM